MQVLLLESGNGDWLLICTAAIVAIRAARARIITVRMLDLGVLPWWPGDTATGLMSDFQRGEIETCRREPVKTPPRRWRRI